MSTTLKTQNPISVWIAELSHESACVRESARTELVALGGDDVIRALIDALDDSHMQVRWEAAKALLALANPVSTTALVNALDDENDGVRLNAAEALIAMKATGLRAVLRGLAMNATSVEFCHSAHHVLHKLQSLSNLICPVIESLKTSQPAVTAPPAAYQALLALNSGRS